jgi:hypothetical protein
LTDVLIDERREGTDRRVSSCNFVLEGEIDLGAESQKVGRWKIYM